MCCVVLDEVCHYVMALFKETISMYIVILSTSQLSCSQGLKLLPAKSSISNLCFILLQFTAYYAFCSPFNNEKYCSIFLKDSREIFLFFPPAELLFMEESIHPWFDVSVCQYHQLKPWTPTFIFTHFFHCCSAPVALYRYDLVLGIFPQLLL